MFVHIVRNADTSALLRDVRGVFPLSCERGGLLALLAGQDACANQSGFQMNVKHACEERDWRP